MPTTLVPESTSIDLIGPYLAAKAVCPACSMENVLLHIEGPTSPVKPLDVCTHIRAHIMDEDGISQFEFEH